MFQLSDELRDDILPYLGIRLEDRGKGQESIWKLEEKEILIKERENKLSEKSRKEEEKKQKAALDLKKKSTPGKEWFITFESEKYTKFDDQGLPTHDINGKEISKEIRNGLVKVQKKQEDTYSKWLKTQESKEEAKTE